jgi:hypothetical protein
VIAHDSQIETAAGRTATLIIVLPELFQRKISNSTSCSSPTSSAVCFAPRRMPSNSQQAASSTPPRSRWETKASMLWPAMCRQAASSNGPSIYPSTEVLWESAAHRRLVLRCRPRGVCALPGRFYLPLDRNSARPRKRVEIGPDRRQSTAIRALLGTRAQNGARWRVISAPPAAPKRWRCAGASADGRCRARTSDLLLVRQALSQLS